MSALDLILGDRLKRNESLARYTAARLGGKADFLYVARSDQDELAAVAQAAWAENLPARIIGGGANILVSDKGFRGLVIVNHISRACFEGHDVVVTSGVALSTLARQCQARGLTGFEWAISVPGTVGGAVINNAGAHGGDMSQRVEWVRVLEAVGGLRQYSASDMRYGYRSSLLKGRQDPRFFVLDAKLNFREGDRGAIQSKMREFMSYRRRTQPPGASLGSIFKNPSGDFAGRLIETCGLKGYTIGGAQVSPVHANFFINVNHATAGDYFALIQYARQVVHEKTGIFLELEVETFGDWQ